MLTHLTHESIRLVREMRDHSRLGRLAGDAKERFEPAIQLACGDEEDGDSAKRA